MVRQSGRQARVAEFSERYRDAFASLGRPLRRGDATPEKQIAAAEKRLGLRVPKALRDYYRVAGRAAKLHSAHDRMLPPAQWSVEARRLIFMEENQAVVLYGTTVGREADDDPAAFMCANDEPVRWYKVNERTSVFLVVMLHWQAAFSGAMPHDGTAKVRPSLKKTLDRTWSFVGEVNHMRAYRKNGQALCFLKWETDWRVFVGCRTEAELAAVARELGLQWDEGAV